jgi:hypothetical protein
MFDVQGKYFVGQSPNVGNDVFAVFRKLACFEQALDGVYEDRLLIDGVVGLEGVSRVAK